MFPFSTEHPLTGNRIQGGDIMRIKSGMLQAPSLGKTPEGLSRALKDTGFRVKVHV